MAGYLLIESRDPFEDRRVDDDYALARSLVHNGDEVTVYLVENGVLPARNGAHADGLADLVATGARVVADAFSLRERAIAGTELRQRVSAAELDLVLEAMESGHKVLWL